AVVGTGDDAVGVTADFEPFPLQAATETASAAVNVTKTLSILILQPRRPFCHRGRRKARQRSRGWKTKARAVPEVSQAQVSANRIRWGHRARRERIRSKFGANSVRGFHGWLKSPARDGTRTAGSEQLYNLRRVSPNPLRRHIGQLLI